MSAKRLRSTVQHKLFGSPEKLSEVCLPTFFDVMKHFHYEKETRKRECAKDPPTSELVKITAEKVVEIWKKASLPVVGFLRVKSMITAYHKKCQDVLKSSSSGSSTQKEKEEALVKKAKEELFDICSCKCPRPQVLCTCKRSQKVPRQEIPFLLDQRTVRKMTIGRVDVQTTSQLRQRLSRKERSRSRSRSTSGGPRKRPKPTENSSSGEEAKISSSNTESGSGTDTDFEVKPSTSGQNRLQLQKVALAARRTGASVRQAALLVSAAYEDVGLVTAGQTENVDKSKIQRATRKLEEEMLKERGQEELSVRGLYFDGKKDLTLGREQEGNRFYKSDRKEEHVCLVQEPGTRYLSHESRAPWSRSLEHCQTRFPAVLTM